MEGEVKLGEGELLRVNIGCVLADSVGYQVELLIDMA